MITTWGVILYILISLLSTVGPLIFWLDQRDRFPCKWTYIKYNITWKVLFNILLVSFIPGVAQVICLAVFIIYGIPYLIKKFIYMGIFTRIRENVGAYWNQPIVSTIRKRS